jgi:hypothetical protein
MGRKLAVRILLGICLLLALLLVTHTIGPIVSGAVFAVSLAVLGVSSGGFRK